jgi:hypothetical protein
MTNKQVDQGCGCGKAGCQNGLARSVGLRRSGARYEAALKIGLASVAHQKAQAEYEKLAARKSLGFNDWVVLGCIAGFILFVFALSQ